MKIKGKLIIFKSKSLTIGAPLSRADITGKAYKGILLTTASWGDVVRFDGESPEDIYKKANQYIINFIDNILEDAIDGTIEVEDVWHEVSSDKVNNYDY